MSRSDEIESLIATFEAGLRGKPDYALHMIGLAEMVAKKKHKLRAFELARIGLAAGQGDPRVVARGRALLHSLLPGYHVPMMNDAWRNAAWDAVLRRAIKPGMQVFEIGTGAGMLALRAARAGAAHVFTCESDPVAAALARELAGHNGYADRITVLDKPSQDVKVGIDLPRPADLLFCDIFGDDLFTFDPLGAIADAKARLLAQGAITVPAAASLRVALAAWSDYPRIGRLESACGFDLTPMADFTTAAKSSAIGDRDLRLMSEPVELLRIAFSESFALHGDVEVTCEASEDGSANGLARWLRLELDGETTLEARPEPGAVFFSSLNILPLPVPCAVRRDEAYTIKAAYSHRKIETWLA